jgi:hypothetical protein
MTSLLPHDEVLESGHHQGKGETEMNNNHLVAFDGVKGYKTYENAVKRGQEISSKYGDVGYRWVVISLPNGRFTPCVIANERTQPCWFASEKNICIVN